MIPILKEDADVLCRLAFDYVIVALDRNRKAQQFPNRRFYFCRFLNRAFGALPHLLDLITEDSPFLCPGLLLVSCVSRIGRDDRLRVVEYFYRDHAAVS